jgi:hypoxia up-regulated 1
MLYKARDITNKMALLDREIKYLLNKAKIWKLKQDIVTNSTDKTAENNTTSGDSDSETQTQSEQNANLNKNDSETTEAEESFKLPTSNLTEPEDKDSKDKHQEL